MGENIIDNIRAYNIVGKEIKATDYVKTRFKKKKICHLCLGERKYSSL